MKKHGSKVVKFDDFAVQSADAQSHIQGVVKFVSREVNRHKLTYRQLKYIFRLVREKCGVEVENGSARRLYELPTHEELKRFYGVIDNPAHKLIFEALEGTGLRISELCNLEVCRIDFKTNLIFVHKGKGDKDRVTVVGSRLLEKFKIYLEGRNNRYLFETQRHSKFSKRRIEQLCQEYAEQAGIIKKLTPHTFRHIWNTRLAEHGISREGREILAGHSKGSATQDIYTHLGVGGIKDEVVAILDGREK
ncbi:MAG: hypothetical protein A4S09_06260 [Proteobacteria bacterium SG_bin7]|nr:MAG: hypothetical protein A4S09_06260 [Proteobacteria bacterium SG_bin7]